MSRILVTGGTGYLGSLLLARQQRHNFQTLGMDAGECDLLDRNAVAEQLAAFAPDVIIHTAAIVPKSTQDYHDNASQDLNLQMIENLLADFHGRFVFCSSMTVYSKQLAMPVREDEATGESLSAYGKNKFIAEQAIMNKSHVSSTILRLPGLFGDMRQAGLIYNIARHLKQDAALTLPQNPALWAAMHVNDAVSCLVRAAENTQTSGIYNISYDEDYSINKLLSILSKIANRPISSDVIHPRFRMDLRRSKQQGLIEPSISLKDRLQELYRKC